MAASAASAGNGGAEAFADAHRRLLSDRATQFQLPPFEPPEAPAWLRPLAEFLQAIFPLLEVLFWIGLAAVALFILHAIGRRLAGADWPWRRGGEEEAPVDLKPEEGRARLLLGEADRLAGEGRFGEAIHLLLFRSIDDIDGRRPNLVRPALTSRDIAGLDAIPPAPRSAFRRLVEAVERNLFAGRKLGAEDWRDCRSAYEQFAFAESWRR